MFHPKKDGSYQLIQGLKCQLPPKGWIYDSLGLTTKNGKPGWVHQQNPDGKDGIYKRSTNPNACYWERDPRWAKVSEWRAEELLRQKTNPSFVHAELADFISECWLHRLGGMWFSNKGKATYITGVHWYYLSCFRQPGGAMTGYRDTDREYFYFWAYCVEDPECFGLIEITKRQQGKSTRAGCIAIEGATANAVFNVGIQSKSDDDAEKFFRKFIIKPYRQLPFFFQPKCNIPLTGNSPAKALRFEESKMNKEGMELDSQIDFQPADAAQYDGQSLRLYIGDEEGKITKIDVLDRWNTVKPGLALDGVIRGKSIHTTTVEEMEAGGAAFLSLWEKSDQYTKEKEGKRRTESGLYRYFLSSSKTRHIDEKYGTYDAERNTREILEERSMITDARSLSSAKRKEPLTEQEAFQMDSSVCVYNPELLNQHLELLTWPGTNKPVYERGNFQWLDGKVDENVVWVANPNGRFMMAYNPPAGWRNRVAGHEGSWRPEVPGLFLGGADPYDNRRTEKSSDRKLSDASLVIGKLPSVNLPAAHIDHGPVLYYSTRPYSPVVYYEDVIMACRYYGAMILAEDNKPGLMNHMEDRGYWKYLAWLPNRNKPGVTAGASVTNELTTLTDNFITEHLHTVAFPELVEQWLKFNPAKTTPFDGAMAFGYMQMLMVGKSGKPYRRETTRKAPALEDVLPFRF